MASKDAGRFRRLPGTARQYLDTTTGATVSRRQRDAILEAAGLRGRMEAGRKAAFQRTMDEYRASVQRAVSDAVASGKPISVKQARQSQELKDANRELRNARKQIKRARQAEEISEEKFKAIRDRYNAAQKRVAEMQGLTDKEFRDNYRRRQNAMRLARGGIFF